MLRQVCIEHGLRVADEMDGPLDSLDENDILETRILCQGVGPLSGTLLAQDGHSRRQIG